MNGLQKFITAALFLFLTLVPANADHGKEKTFSYIPNIHGTVRPRFELDTESGDARFAMRNSRLSLDARSRPKLIIFCSSTSATRVHSSRSISMCACRSPQV